MQRKTRFCRFFATDEGCQNGSSCAFAHNAEELQASILSTDIASSSCSDDSTSVCSEETSLASIWTSETCDVLPQLTGQSWADVTDNEDDEWPSMWAPDSKPVMRELSIAPVHAPMPLGVRSVASTNAASKAEHREQCAAAAKAKRAALTEAVLEGLLRQAQSPYVYQD